MRATAHPRVGGENSVWGRAVRPVPGSSPRGRGKPCLHMAVSVSSGLIPAWAGKTVMRTFEPLGARAHPRVGGENLGRYRLRQDVIGSSPRGRGKPYIRRRRAGIQRLIPAWAGKTSWRLAPPRDRGAHPRVGGENLICRDHRRVLCGSSPRGRGKPHCSDQRTLRGGLIPAWAGKTSTGSVLPDGCRAHPRVGGENAIMTVISGALTGSSPRGRGKQFGGFGVDAGLRLIPAWAGKTSAFDAARSARAAHPRVGGENRHM